MARGPGRTGPSGLAARDPRALPNALQPHVGDHDVKAASRDATSRLSRAPLAPGAAGVGKGDDRAAGHFERAAREAGARLIRITRDADEIREVAILEAEVGMEGRDAWLRLPSGEVELGVWVIGELN